MKDQKAISRRKFLKFAGGIMGGGVLLCGGGAYLGLQSPSSVVFPRSSCGDGGEGRVLVAYASKCGATGEIAERIAQNLCDRGFVVELGRAKEISSVNNYAAVVLGTAIYMGSPLKESLDFARDHLAGQTGKKVALFNVCLTMKENTQENLEISLGYLDGFKEYLDPDLTAAFAGRVDLDTLPFLYRQFAQADKEGILAEGDYRDWDAIDRWAQEIDLTV